MARTRSPEAPIERTPELVITAGEWEAMLLEDPQASPDWKQTWPYGSWRWRLPNADSRGRPQLPASDADQEPDDEPTRVE